MYFVDLTSDWYSASFPSITNAISYYTGPHYNGTWLYHHHCCAVCDVIIVMLSTVLCYIGPCHSVTSLHLRTSHALNTLRGRQDGHHFPDDIFICIFLNENESHSIKMSLKFVPRVPISNISALVQIMAWRRQGDKPLSELMMVVLPTHICITRPQWVKCYPVSISMPHEADMLSWWANYWELLNITEYDGTYQKQNICSFSEIFMLCVCVW